MMWWPFNLATLSTLIIGHGYKEAISVHVGIVVWMFTTTNDIAALPIVSHDTLLIYFLLSPHVHNKYLIAATMH